MVSIFSHHNIHYYCHIVVNLNQIDHSNFSLLNHIHCYLNNFDEVVIIINPIFRNIFWSDYFEQSSCSYSHFEFQNFYHDSIIDEDISRLEITIILGLFIIIIYQKIEVVISILVIYSPVLIIIRRIFKKA